MALSKRIKSLSEKVDRNKLYTVKDGLALVKTLRKLNLMNLSMFQLT